ncbi:MAG: AraC family transcriptional regulator [Bacteroidia bacterium]|nr:AraC family transcriptional regulator [Bacteroidia bacterium]
MKYILYYGLAVPAIALLAGLSVRDYRSGNLVQKQTSSIIRMTALSLFLLLTVTDLCAAAPSGGCSPLLNLQAAAAVLLLSPHSYSGKGKYTLVSASVFAAVCSFSSLSLALTGTYGGKTEVFSLLVLGCVMLHSCMCLKMRYADIKSLFRGKSVRYSMEDYASHCYSLLLLASVCLGLLSDTAPPVFAALLLICALLAVSAAVYGAYRKSADASIVYLGEKKLLQIRNMMTGEAVERSAKVQARMKSMYERIEKYMVEHKPYLDENFTIGDLADAMLSNRVYISRAINRVTGNNFCNLVNRYRVAHSQMLWKLNPHLKMKDIYSGCGFHTAVSFISAFRTVTGYTPVEWLKESSAEKLRKPSASEEIAA